jgi:hypothetical protein
LRAALVGLAALAIGMGIGRFAFTPILPMMQAEGLSLAAGGWLASANYAGYLAGALSGRPESRARGCSSMCRPGRCSRARRAASSIPAWAPAARSPDSPVLC